MRSHCCEAMRAQVELVCPQHPDPADCPDHLVSYSPTFREYGLLIHDGGSSSINIRFCPWCGSRLPESLRHEWFAELGKRGLEPWMDEVPAEFRTAEWWLNRPIRPGG